MGSYACSVLCRACVHGPRVCTQTHSLSHTHTHSPPNPDTPLSAPDSQLTRVSLRSGPDALQPCSEGRAGHGQHGMRSHPQSHSFLVGGDSGHYVPCSLEALRKGALFSPRGLVGEAGAGHCGMAPGCCGQDAASAPAAPGLGPGPAAPSSALWWPGARPAALPACSSKAHQLGRCLRGQVLRRH